MTLEMKFERKTQSLKDQAKVPISYSKNLNCKGFVVGIGPLYREKTKIKGSLYVTVFEDSHCLQMKNSGGVKS